MRFILLGPTYPFRGGIAHHTTRLYHALRARHSIEFITFRRQYPKWLYPGRSDKDPTTDSTQTSAQPLLDSLNPVTWFQTAFHIRSQKADALILPWWIAFWALPFATISYWAKRSGTSVIFVCHNLSSHEPFPAQVALSRMALKQGNAFVVQSADDIDRLKVLIPEARVKSVRHPIYEPYASALPPVSRTTANENATLLFFGFVRPYKGLNVLLEALSLVSKVRPVRLVVAGEFWEDRATFELLLAQLGIRNFVTLIDRYIPDEELVRLFADTDIVVMPYLWTMTSAVLGLAVGYGVPVIVSDIGDLGKIVRENSIGDVAKPGNVSDLARVIIDSLEPSRLEGFRKNVEKMRQGAARSWEQLVDAIEELAMDGNDRTG